jgi:short-subunit dehydrogenase
MSFALITGASKGIGRAIARELASRKIDVLLVARSETLLAELTAEIKKEHGVQSHYLVLDLSRPDAAERIYSWCAGQNYRVSFLINNAGYGLSGSFESRSLEESVDMLNVLILSAVKLMRLFLPHLREQKKAYILNIGSSAAYQAVPYLAAYAAAKSFMVSFSRALKYELRNSNVVVSVVSPGVTDTDFPIRANVPEKGLKTAEKISMSPEAVARIAVSSMFKGRTEVVTGLLTKATFFFVKLLPKKLT